MGYVQYAAPITVDVEGGTKYTTDWAAFLATEAKVKPNFKGNVVDFGSKYTLPELIALFNPGSPTSMATFPLWNKAQISEGQRCFTVGKDGNTTDLTVGHFAGLVSFTRNEAGIESIELGIYNSGPVKHYDEPFSAKGDSGALVWHLTGETARIVGQIHSGNHKGGSTSNYITYCTPGWHLLDQIKKRFKYADFYPVTW